MINTIHEIFTTCIGPTYLSAQAPGLAKIVIRGGKLVEDVECNSPSIAGVFVYGKKINGWVSWKNERGDLIDVYRKEK